MPNLHTSQNPAPPTRITTPSPPAARPRKSPPSSRRHGLLALHAFLRETDPNHERLGLRRMPTPTGDYVWLCQDHYDQAQPKIPDIIE